ncbi:MAG: hypothetical protein GY729_06920, partial [Desulfobacteraceae bacterium]|nr:hypothetical protein [Desulfobacteraceae bacterium]
MDNHEQATRLVLEYTPEIPLWVQLPFFEQEGMINQFLPGLPGLTVKNGKQFLDTSSPEFDQDFIDFFEEYLLISDTYDNLDTSRFAFADSEGKGFFEFLKQVDTLEPTPIALKGQVTGPVTFCTAVKDEDDRAIFYNDQLRDAAIKKLAMNAKWQARSFAQRDTTPIIFIDEPALAGFGTSAYITITKDDVTGSIEEITQEIHSENGLAGVHVCANTEWDMLLETNIDIISFDAYSFFDRFILYPETIKKFILNKGILACGIVPTHKAEVIAEETAQNLVEKFTRQMDQIIALGLDREQVFSQTFITPSCGTGSLDLDSAKKVLHLTKKVSETVRSGL